MNHKIAILYTTVGSLNDAQNLAKLVLENKLAACINIIPQGKSLYLWKGNIEEGNECYLICKTKPDLLQSLEDMIKKNHPYELPAILKFIPESSQGFYNYIIDSLSANSLTPV